jgi:VCBS repeat-containing protein
VPLFDFNAPNSGWDVLGTGSVTGTSAQLAEDPLVITMLSRNFTVPAGATAVQFTVTSLGLVESGPGQPPDAFELALLETATFTPLIGPATGLSNTDSLLNIQQTGEVFFAPQVNVAGAGASGQAAQLTTPFVVTIDLSGVTAGTSAELFFNLLGFGDLSSTVSLEDIHFVGVSNPHPPVAAGDAYTASEDVALVVPALAGLLANDSDPDAGDTKTLVAINGQSAAVGTAVTLASGAVVIVQSDGSLRFDPSGKFESLKPGQTATETFTYEMADSTSTRATATATITIQGANDAPVAQNDTFSTLQGVSLSIPAPGVLANDADIDGDSLSAIKLTDPTSGTLALDASGGFTFVPAANFVGSTSFMYLASDGLDSATATVTIVVSSAGAPVANPDSYTVNEDQTLAVPAPGLLANDVPPPGVSLTATLVSGPAHGTLILLPSGSFTYSPTANFNGLDTFVYRAHAGPTPSATNATVTIAVKTVNDRPTANNDAASTRHDQLLIVAAPGVLANDTDVDLNDSNTVVAVNDQPGALGNVVVLPSGALLNMRPDGSYWYDPSGQFDSLAVGQTATDSFSYTIRDQAGALATAQVIVTISRTAAANSISGSVYADVNNDGVRHPAELALPQVLVRLEGPVVRSVRTDASGHYRFENLPDGVYVLWEYHPQSFLDGKDTPGTPKLGVTGNDRFTGIALAGGVAAVDYNFAERGLKSPNKTLELASTNIHEVLMAIMAVDEPPTLEAQLDRQLGTGLVGVRNLRNPLDVSDDGFVSPVDALMVINVLNSGSHGGYSGVATLAAGISAGPYYDTSGDSLISPLDALQVINYLNSKRTTSAAEGEGESGGSMSDGPLVGSEIDCLLELLACDVAADRRKRAP